MNDYLARLADALDRDEAVARATAPTPPDWHVDEDGIGDTVVWWPPEPEVAERERARGFNVTADRWQGQQFDHETVAAHVARHDPARVLRHAEKLRAALALREETAESLNGPAYAGKAADNAYTEAFLDGCDAILSLLADIYTEEQQ